MKKLLYTTFLLSIFALTGCFKDYEKRYLFTDNRVEFDAAVIHPNGSGVSFPWLTPVANDVGTVRYRVNMTGEQKNVDRVVNFRIVPEHTTAREGIDFRLPHGTSFVIPANSSFGWVEVEVLPSGAGSPRVVLELLPSGDINVMDRYHQIGQQILYPYNAPERVEEINDIRYFQDITLGSSSNPNVGNYIDLLTGYAYIASGSDQNQEKIDIIVLRSGTGTEHNLLTPSSGSVTAWGTSSRIATEWDVRNNGQIMLLPDASSVELGLFENAQTKADLEAAYQYYFNNIENRPGYNSYHGPSTRVRQVESASIVAFRSSSRDVVAIMRVDESIPGAAGHLRGDLKSAGEGNP